MYTYIQEFHQTQRIFWWWKVMSWHRISQIRQARRALERWRHAVYRGRRRIQAEEYDLRLAKRKMLRRWRRFTGRFDGRMDGCISKGEKEVVWGSIIYIIHVFLDNVCSLYYQMKPRLERR